MGASVMKELAVNIFFVPSSQGVCQIMEVIFSDISLIFPWFLPCFPWFNIGPEQILHTTSISDNLNTYHYASLFK